MRKDREHRVPRERLCSKDLIRGKRVPFIGEA